MAHKETKSKLYQVLLSSGIPLLGYQIYRFQRITNQLEQNIQ